jgi:hypothetical protein
LLTGGIGLVQDFQDISACAAAFKRGADTGTQFHVRDFARCIKFGNAMPTTIGTAGGSAAGIPEHGKN